MRTRADGVCGVAGGAVVAGLVGLSSLLFTAGEARAQAPAGNLKINEIDYDQFGIDTGEFVEILNMSACPVALDGLAMVLINGSSNLEYARYSLTLAGPVLNPGQFLVFRNPTVTVAPGAIVANLPQDALQNGAPDAIAIIDTVNRVVIDSLSYEGAITAAVITGFSGPVNLVNGTAFPTADPGVITGEPDGAVPASLERALSGVDTGDDLTDWHLIRPPNPGQHGPGTPSSLIPCCGSSDYNGDGDFGTDADIEAFFACLGGNCCTVCSSDFNADGDFGTDADIEAFFRVLGGGSC